MHSRATDPKVNEGQPGTSRPTPRYCHLQPQQSTSKAWLLQQAATTQRHRRKSTVDQHRLYRTLPPTRRSIHFEEQIHLADIRRISAYPKSLQDLTNLEIEAILERDPRPSSASNWPPRRSQDHDLDEKYERLCRSMAQLDQTITIDKVVPGEVHYEKEYRVYGKDTIALIYYKTCYLWCMFCEIARVLLLFLFLFSERMRDIERAVRSALLFRSTHSILSTSTLNFPFENFILSIQYLYHLYKPSFKLLYNRRLFKIVYSINWAWQLNAKLDNNHLEKVPTIFVSVLARYGNSIPIDISQWTVCISNV